MHQEGGLNVQLSRFETFSGLSLLRVPSPGWGITENGRGCITGCGLNALRVPQLPLPVQWPESAARSFQLVVAKQKMAADASRRWPERAARFSAGSNGSVA
jgi:hypothetical protein